MIGSVVVIFVLLLSAVGYYLFRRFRTTDVTVIIQDESRERKEQHKEVLLPVQPESSDEEEFKEPEPIEEEVKQIE